MVVVVMQYSIDNDAICTKPMVLSYGCVQSFHLFDQSSISPESWLYSI
jgi:hypothetical protein